MRKIAKAIPKIDKRDTLAKVDRDAAVRVIVAKTFAAASDLQLPESARVLAGKIRQRRS